MSAGYERYLNKVIIIIIIIIVIIITARMGLRRSQRFCEYGGCRAVTQAPII